MSIDASNAEFESINVAMIFLVSNITDKLKVLVHHPDGSSGDIM